MDRNQLLIQTKEISIWIFQQYYYERIVKELFTSSELSNLHSTETRAVTVCRESMIRFWRHTNGRSPLTSDIISLRMKAVVTQLKYSGIYFLYLDQKLNYIQYFEGEKTNVDEHRVNEAKVGIYLFAVPGKNRSKGVNQSKSINVSWQKILHWYRRYCKTPHCKEYCKLDHFGFNLFTFWMYLLFWYTLLFFVLLPQPQMWWEVSTKVYTF